MKIDIMPDEERVIAWTGYAAREVMKSIPGGRWNKEHMAWTYPMIYPSVVSLVEAANFLRESVQSSDRAKEWAAEEAGRWAMLFDMAADVRGGRDPWDGESPMPTFFPHQEQAAEWIALDGAEGGRLDAGETGSGKTRAALRAAWKCWNAGETGVLLVSTMASVKHGWASEVERIKDELPLPDGAQWDVRILRGTAPQRRKMFDALPDDGVGVVLITNHEQLKIHSRLSGYGDVKLNRCEACGGGAEAVKEASCHAHEKELNKVKMVAMVIDEAHRFMNPRSQQTRAGWYLADHAPRKWALTGTPGSTSVVENTWALLRLVVGEKWPSKSKWCEYFAHTGYNIEGYWEVGNLKPEREDEFRKMYGSLTRRVLKAQVLDLPPLLRGGSLERVITMGTAQAAAYAQMRDELMVQIEDGTVTAGNILAQTTRLIQLAQACGMPGPLYGQVIGQDKDGNDIIDSTMNLTAPSCKVDAVVDMVKSGDVGPGTVFQFVSAQLLFMVRDALVAKGLIREHEFGAVAGPVKEYARGLAIDKFQSGKIPFFAFTVAAGGAGITLTRSNTMVAVERPWSPVLWKQAEDRVHRIGSEIHESVSIIDLITEDTVETRQIERVLGNKESLEAIVQDRAKLKELLS